MELPDKISKSVYRKTFNLAAVSLLLALSIGLSIIESFLPITNIMPGIKIGLSNIVTMFALGSIGLIQAIVISTVKSLFILFIKGPLAFLLSFAGGIFSIFVMRLFFSIKKFLFSFIFVSIIGAISHNLAQVLIANFFVGKAVFYYLPVLIIFAVFSGVFTGECLKVITPFLTKLKK